MIQFKHKSAYYNLMGCGKPYLTLLSSLDYLSSIWCFKTRKDKDLLIKRMQKVVYSSSHMQNGI